MEWQRRTLQCLTSLHSFGIRHCTLKSSIRLFINFNQKRFYNLQEYQSDEILRQNGICVPRFLVANSMSEAEFCLKSFDSNRLVVKAQILAGGRGRGNFTNGLLKCGGVKLTQSKNEALDYIGDILGNCLVTKQTSKEGVVVKTVMVAEACNVAHETYLAILMDRETSGPVIVVSPHGGMDIEDVALKFPEMIFKEFICISDGVSRDTATHLAIKMKFEGDSAISQAADHIMKLYELFLKLDATQIEINPLALTHENEVVCLDAKLNFDDSAAFRQKSIFEMRDFSDISSRELEAKRFQLNYIGLDGNIACLVNGAGLAMATMDVIDLHGGRPANFLDVGGRVTEQQVTKAFEIITSDSKVKAILVNIFGGIINCATIANGLVEAFRTVKLEIPLVVRLEGNSVDLARNILKSSKLPIINAFDLDDAGRKAVECIS